MGTALFFLAAGILLSVLTASTVPLRAAGTASFLFAFLSDRLRPGYQEFWKAMGYALFFFIGIHLVQSQVDAWLLIGFWFLLLASRWRGLHTLWREETPGYRILLVAGLTLLTWILCGAMLVQADR